MIKTGEIACLGYIFSCWAMLGLSLSSCGIDTISYLTEDPVSISSDGTSSFIFYVKESGSVSYLGADLFYRIYASSIDADSDKNYVIAKQSEVNAVPGTLIESNLISSSGMQYKSPVVNDTIKIPIISVDDIVDQDSYIILSFPGNMEPSYYINPDSSTLFFLKRNVIDPSGGYKSFIDDPPEVDDQDYKSRVGDTDNEYYVQFFAAAYGLNISNFEDLYGDAVYLGRIVLNF